MTAADPNQTQVDNSTPRPDRGPADRRPGTHTIVRGSRNYDRVVLPDPPSDLPQAPECKVTFDGCARCGGAHEDLLTERLIRPFAPSDITAQVWSHWALCPATWQPILIVLEDPQPEVDAPNPAARVFPPGDHRGVSCRACEAAVGEPCIDLPRRIDAPRMCTHDRPHVVRVNDARGKT